MNAYIRPAIACVLAVALLLAAGCTGAGKSAMKAVYLAPENGGQLSKEDVSKYPELILVNSFDDLKKSVSRDTAVWIDKDSVNTVDAQWLWDKALSKVPIVLVGYNNALYSFRDRLGGFGMEGPYVDWSQQKLEPGFSVWMLKEKTPTATSAFMKGYDTTPDTKQILSITDMLLEGKYPE